MVGLHLAGVEEMEGGEKTCLRVPVCAPLQQAVAQRPPEVIAVMAVMSQWHHHPCHKAHVG